MLSSPCSHLSARTAAMEGSAQCWLPVPHWMPSLGALQQPGSGHQSDLFQCKPVDAAPMLSEYLTSFQDMYDPQDLAECRTLALAGSTWGALSCA